MTAPVVRHAILLAGLAGAAFATPAAACHGGGCYRPPVPVGCASVECYRRVATPPVYDTYSEQRLVRPPRTVYHTSPPVYDTVSERVMVSPGGRVWQQRYDAYGHLVGCWVTTPPQYAIRSRRVLVRPAEVIPETLPPVYASFSRRVMVAPPSSQWVPAGGYGGDIGIGSIPDAVGITGASSADIGVGLGFSSGSIYDGYGY